MSFHGGFSVFEDDPFFSGFPTMPSMGFGLQRHPALGGRPPMSDHGHQGNMQLAQRRDPFGSMWPFGGGDPFARMDAMMNQMMQEADSNPNAHCYSSSSVMHYSSGSGEGRQPRVYHATTSTRQAPGGIKETRRTVRDSESGMHKMAIGHHIHDRSHTIEKRHNTKTNDREEHQEFVNLEESDVSSFDEEWQQKTRHVNARLNSSLQPSHHTRGLPSIESNRHTSTKHHSSAHASAPKHHPYDISHHARPHKRHGHLESLDPSQAGLDPSQAGPSRTPKRHHTQYISQGPVTQTRHEDHLEPREMEGKGKSNKKRVRF